MKPNHTFKILTANFVDKPIRFHKDTIFAKALPEHILKFIRKSHSNVLSVETSETNDATRELVAQYGVENEISERSHRKISMNALNLSRTRYIWLNG